jgi:hypothetical protein
MVGEDRTVVLKADGGDPAQQVVGDRPITERDQLVSNPSIPTSTPGSRSTRAAAFATAWSSSNITSKRSPLRDTNIEKQPSDSGKLTGLRNRHPP